MHAEEEYIRRCLQYSHPPCELPEPEDANSKKGKYENASSVYLDNLCTSFPYCVHESGASVVTCDIYVRLVSHESLKRRDQKKVGRRENASNVYLGDLCETIRRCVHQRREPVVS